MKKGLIVFGIIYILSGFISVSVGETTVLTETRAVWFDKSDVYKGKDYLVTMFDKLTTANFNTVCLPVLYRGYVIYPNSKFLPQDPHVRPEGSVSEGKIVKVDKDILAWMIEQAHLRGLIVESWPEFGFYAYYTRDATKDTSRGVILDKEPELTAIDINGQHYLHNAAWGDFYSLCPSNPKSQQIMFDLLCESITKYQFDGLNLDRIRYPTNEFCFCRYCKTQFKKDTGFVLTKESLENERVLKAFYAWRKEQLNKFMQKVSKRVRKLQPGILITADVWIPDEIDGKGQDWPYWLKNGYIDIAIPMMYWGNIEKGLNDSVTIAPDSRRILAGISAEINSSEKLANQIELARKKNCGGVVIWYLGKLDDDLEYLRTTVFIEPSKPFKP